MTATPTGDSEAAQAEAAHLLSPAAIRERAEALYALGLRGELEHFAIAEQRLDGVVDRVLGILRSTYPSLADIPYHSRWRHFGAGGVDRLADLEERLRPLDAQERLAAQFELAITSVLLDAGAGQAWSYVENGRSFTRSEGLAVASYWLFVNGGLARDPERAPLHADAEVLSRITADELGRAFQVRADNPLVGLEGRAAILRSLGRAVIEQPAYFGARPRLGGLSEYLLKQSSHGRLRATEILRVVLEALGTIWPGREVLAGRNLGDVWRHPRVGLVPLHKLSQWLSYSLCEPLERYGVQIDALDELTGLAEYRNGGLFVDAGVLVPKHDRVTGETHAVSSSVIVEWRALTVALLDRTARLLRQRLEVTERELPLAKVLEAGTWRAGREIAGERRAGASPPIRIESDGTVF